MALFPNTINIGGLFHNSFIDRKTESFVTEFNNMACSNNVIILCLQIFSGNNSTFSTEHTNLDLETTCSLCIYEIYVYPEKYIYVLPSFLIYSKDKADIFKRYSYFLGISTVDNIDSVVQRFFFYLKLAQKLTKGLPIRYNGYYTWWNAYCYGFSWKYKYYLLFCV